MTMRQSRSFIFVAAALIAAVVGCTGLSSPDAAEAASKPSFTSDGKLTLHKGYPHWVSIGAPLKPDGLNNGKAGFPEYHNVYVQEGDLAGYRKNGVFPEGSVIAKALLLLRGSTHPDGSLDSPSDRGFSQGAFNGMDVMVKDKKRFAQTNGWGFFNFGHHAQPYEASAKAATSAECSGCHQAGAAKKDMTGWTSTRSCAQGSKLPL